MANTFNPFKSSFGGKFHIANKSTAPLNPAGPKTYLSKREVEAKRLNNAGTSAGVKKSWDTRHLFDPMVSRKENDETQIASSHWNDLSDEQREALKTKPKIDI